MMVGVAHLKLVKETGAKLWIIYLGIITVVITLVVFTIDTLADEPTTALALVIFLILSVVADRFWRDIPYLKPKDAPVASTSELTTTSD